MRPDRTQPKKSLLSVVPFLAYLLCAIALACYGILNRDPPLLFPAYSGLLLLSFAVLLTPWLRMVVKRYRQEEALTGKLIGTMLVMLWVGLWFAYVGTFNGVARLLHGAENQPGEMIATVTGKYPYSSRRQRCARLRLQEFRFSVDELCAEGRLYNTVKVGDRIRLSGDLSRYGLNPNKLERVDEE